MTHEEKAQIKRLKSGLESTKLIKEQRLFHNDHTLWTDSEEEDEEEEKDEEEKQGKFNIKERKSGSNNKQQTLLSSGGTSGGELEGVKSLKQLLTLRISDVVRMAKEEGEDNGELTGLTFFLSSIHSRSSTCICLVYLTEQVFFFYNVHINDFKNFCKGACGFVCLF